MEEFDFNEKMNKRLDAAVKLFSEGLTYGLDLADIISKIASVKKALDDGIIRIVLLGSFSDGKTSAIAGLLGRLEDTMKIDNDESSDELTIYRPAGLKKGFEIVDTPGLFGTKEKEIDGKNVRYSEVTERYISEAHIIIYVCDAVNPIKDSHVEIIHKVMRDYQKLDNTIFVLNKMDEAGFDLTDDEDFKHGQQIKKENVISRLRNTINLTPDEEKQLHIICISADPKGKGLVYWFAKTDDYLRRSHIGSLRQCIDSVIDKCDKSSAVKSTSLASIDDAVKNVSEQISETNKPLEKSLRKMDDQILDLQSDVKQTKNDLSSSRTDMRNRLNNLKCDVLSDIKYASLETIGDVIDRDLGVQDGKVTFYVFNAKVQSLISSCGETNSAALTQTSVKFEKIFNMQESMIKDAVKLGASKFKNLTISGEQVKAVRDVIAKGYKFKPWGAINTGKNFVKWGGKVFSALTIFIEIHDWYKIFKDQKELQNLKKDLCNALDNQIAECFRTFESDDTYYQNFAPSYIELCKLLKSRTDEIDALKKKVEDLNKYKDRLSNWYKSDIEDAESEKI